MHTLKRNGKTYFGAYAGYSDGKRIRVYAKTKDELDAKLRAIKKERRDVGALWSTLKPAQKTDLLNVAKEILDAGLSFRDVWTAYQTHQTAAGSIQPKPLAAAALEFYAAKKRENKRPNYLAMLSSTTTRFCQQFDGWQCHEIQRDHVQTFLDQFDNADTRAGAHQRLSTFLAWCALHRFTLANPCDLIKKPRTDAKRPAILTVDQAAQLIKTAALVDRALVPSIALKLFAGVRPQECERLHWNALNLEKCELVIDGAASKIRDIRIAKLPDNCVAWIRTAKAGRGLIQPAKNHRKRFDAIRTLSGIPWKKDILRHTAASHYYNRNGAVATAKAFGHSEAILFKHYRALVQDAETDAFYSIAPTGQGGPTK